MSDSLERDLAELEATDPAVRAASERLDQTVASIVEGSRSTESTSAALRRVEQERDRARSWAQHLQHNVDFVVAELVSARTELDAVRTARDNLDRELAEARAAEPGDDVLYRQARYACEQCGSRYGIAYTDHPCGPLTPVTVTITRRTEESETT